MSSLLRLTNLTTEVRQLLQTGQIDMGHARALLSLNSPWQAKLAREIVAKSLSVRQTENRVKNFLLKKNSEKSLPDPDVTKLEQYLAEKIGFPVTIQHTNKGNGKLVISYSSLDQLDGILDNITRT